METEKYTLEIEHVPHFNAAKAKAGYSHYKMKITENGKEVWATDEDGGHPPSPTAGIQSLLNIIGWGDTAYYEELLQMQKEDDKYNKEGR